MIAIGIDIGGTSFKGAAVDENGKVFEKFVLPVSYPHDQNEIINQLIDLTDKYIKENNFENELMGIGLGIPGSIDSVNGVCTYSNNLKWEDLHIIDMFKQRFSCPIRITNDANAAALGEAVFGAGKNHKDVVMITLGTGVGSGIICNGQIYEGLNGKGAEIGHTTLVSDGIPCTCGRRGCFEMYASATALIRQTEEAMKQNKNSLLWKVSQEQGKVNGRTAFEAEKLGDETAKKVIDQYIKYLGEGLLNICNVFRPEVILLSGGIANEKENLTKRLIPYLEKYSYGYPRSPKTEIKIAELGYESGIIGAASLILNR